MKKKILALTLSLSLILGTTPVFAKTSDTFEKPKVTILALGDSITTGSGLTNKNDSYLNKFASKFDPAIFETSIINNAVDGYTSSDLLNELQSTANTNADFVTVTIGGNNILKPFREALDSKIKSLPAGTPNPMVVAMDSLLKDPVAINSMSLEINQGILKFQEDFPKIINAIKKNNGHAIIFLQTVYNPFSVVSGFEKLSTIVDSYLNSPNGINTAITQFATAEKDCIVTDVYSMFKGNSPYFTNIMNNDIHPNSIGHETMANSLFCNFSNYLMASIYKIPVDSILSDKLNNDNVVINAKLAKFFLHICDSSTVSNESSKKFRTFLEGYTEKIGSFLKTSQQEISISDLPWYVKVQATVTDDSSALWSTIASSMPDKKILSLMDVELIDITTGGKYTAIEKPLTVSIKIPSNITDYSNLIIAHRKDSGEIEYITPTIKDGYATFTLSSFSPIGLVTSVTNTNTTSNTNTGTTSNTDSASETVAKTGDTNAVLPILLMGILSLTFIVFFNKKKSVA
jgi:LPXTG-motif cell wall-anchored protein